MSIISSNNTQKKHRISSEGMVDFRVTHATDMPGIIRVCCSVVVYIFFYFDGSVSSAGQANNEKETGARDTPDEITSADRRRRRSRKEFCGFPSRPPGNIYSI